MRRFFARNLGFQGRLARGVVGTLVLIAGIAAADSSPWICLALVAPGLFALVEAVAGWCVVRACGIRTKSSVPFGKNLAEYVRVSNR